jgi:hypothetical protein
MDDPESQFDDCNVICPYCKASYQFDGHDYTDTPTEETCYKCEKTYIRWDEASITHYTRPIEDK